MSGFVPENKIILEIPDKPTNYEDFLQGLSKDCGLRLPSHQNMLDPVNEM